MTRESKKRKNPLNKKNKSGHPDFKRQKVKVGRRIAPKADTDTTVRSRKLMMPTQNAVMGKKGKAVTKRALNLNDLLAQCNHYSESVRKDAVLGLRELVTSHPHVLEGHLSRIILAAVKRLTDDAKLVRDAVKLMVEQLLDQVSHTAMGPFLPTMYLYTCTALTHVSERVRLDALHFVNLLVHRYPDVASHYLDKLLPNYTTLLSSKRATLSTSRSKSPALSKKARLSVLQSLRALLEATSDHPLHDVQPDVDHTDHVTISFDPHRRTDARFARRLPTQSETNDLLDLDVISSSSSTSSTSSTTTSSLSSSNPLLPFALDAIPLLVELWLEIDEDDGDLLDTLVHNLYLLVGICTHADTDLGRGLDLFAAHLVADFPYSVKDNAIDRRVARKVDAYIAATMALLLRDDWLPLLTEYVVHELDLFAEQEEDDLSYDSERLVVHVAVAILDHCTDTDDSNEFFREAILDALLRLEASAHTRSRRKALCIDTLAELMHWPDIGVREPWIHLFGRLLWELKDSQPHRSALILRALLDLVRRPAGADVLPAISRALVPFFHVSVSRNGSTRSVYGPFVALPLSVRNLALNLAWYLDDAQSSSSSSPSSSPLNDAVALAKAKLETEL